MSSVFENCIICNLDNLEYINPIAFGDPRTSSQFMLRSNGVLSALSVLTTAVDKDDDATGYLSRTALSTMPDFQETTYDRLVCERVIYKNYAGADVVRRVFVPKYTGRWAGCRIVTANTRVKAIDYPSLDIEAYRHPGGPCHPDDITLQGYMAVMGQDISYTLKTQLTEYKRGPVAPQNFTVVYESIMGERLIRHFSKYRLNKRQRRQYDIRWMSLIDLCHFLRHWKTVSDVKTAKAWLRSQTLDAWQSTAIGYYRHDVEGISDRDFATLQQIMREHNVPVGNHAGQFNDLPLIPNATYARAALAVQMATDDLPPIPGAEPAIVHAIEQKLNIKSRVISLDSGS